MQPVASTQLSCRDTTEPPPCCPQPVLLLSLVTRTCHPPPGPGRASVAGAESGTARLCIPGNIVGRAGRERIIYSCQSSPRELEWRSCRLLAVQHSLRALGWGAGGSQAVPACSCSWSCKKQEYSLPFSPQYSSGFLSPVPPCSASFRAWQIPFAAFLPPCTRDLFSLSSLVLPRPICCFPH